jgi:hypothetical protein
MVLPPSCSALTKGIVRRIPARRQTNSPKRYLFSPMRIRWQSRKPLR